MLEEMGESSFAWLFVLRAHVVPDVDGDDWRLVILVHDKGQAVVEDELLEWDVDVDVGSNCAGVERRDSQQD
jgi:hypothetical protein